MQWSSPSDDGNHHGGDGEHNHEQVEAGTSSDGVGIADRGRVRRILEHGDDVDGDEPEETQRCCGAPCSEQPEPAVREGEHEREDAAERDPVDERTRTQAGGALQ